MTAIIVAPALGVASSGDDFRISAPAEWKKISEDQSGGVFVRGSGARKPLIIAVTYDLAARDLVSPERLFEFSKEIGVLRAAKMAAWGLANYSLLEVRRIPSEVSGIDFEIELESRYLDFSAQPVQVIERQYFSQHKLFQVIYEERGDQIADRTAATAAILNFSPNVKIDAKMVTSDGRSPASETKIGEQRSRSAPSSTERSNVDPLKLPRGATLAQCQTVPAERRRTSQDDATTLDNLGKILLGCLGSIGLPMNWEDWKKLDQTDLVGVAATRAREGIATAYAKIAGYWSDSRTRAAMNTSVFAFGESALHPIEISKRIAVTLSEYASRTSTEWPCLTEKYRSKVLCEIAGALTAAKSAFSLGRLGLTRLLSETEKKQIQRATEEVLEREAPAGGEVPKTVATRGSEN